MTKPEKNTSGKPRPVPADVKEKQDTKYSLADFDAALGKATRRLDDPAEPDPGSSKTGTRRRAGGST